MKILVILVYYLQRKGGNSMNEQMRIFQSHLKKYGQIIRYKDNDYEVFFKDYNDYKGSSEHKYMYIKKGIVNQGDTIYAFDSNWIIVNKIINHNDNIYDKVVIRQSKYKIAFILQDELFHFDALIDTLIHGVSTNSNIAMPTGSIILTMQENLYTSLIGIDKRLITMNQPYKVVGVDTSEFGLIKLTCERTVFLPTDDRENQIADRFDYAFAVGIEIKQNPMKLSYKVGEEIDLNGLQVILKYEDDTSEDLELEELEIDEFDNLLLGMQTIYIRYKNHTTSFQVYVSEIYYYSITIDYNNEFGNIDGLEQKYEEGSVANIVAIPNEGYKFVHWADEGGEIIGEDAMLEIVVNGDRSVVAVFKSESLQVIIDGHDTIRHGSSSGRTYTSNVDVDSWSVCDTRILKIMEHDSRSCRIIEHSGSWNVIGRNVYLRAIINGEVVAEKEIMIISIM